MDQLTDEFSGIHRLVSLRIWHRLRGRGRRAEDSVQAEERKCGQVYHDWPVVHLATSKREWCCVVFDNFFSVEHLMNSPIVILSISVRSSSGWASSSRLRPSSRDGSSSLSCPPLLFTSSSPGSQGSRCWRSRRIRSGATPTSTKTTREGRPS